MCICFVSWWQQVLMRRKEDGSLDGQIGANGLGGNRVMIEFMSILCFAVAPLPIVYIVAQGEFHIALFELRIHYNQKFY